MQQRFAVRIVPIFAAVVISTTVAHSQSQTSTEVFSPEAKSHTWSDAQLHRGSNRKFYVVTFDHPSRKSTCRVQSLGADKLVCARVIGSPRIYRLNQIAALIIPGDDVLRRRVLLGLGAGIGAGIWGTVVLAATCPACAVGSGIAAFILFSAFGAIGVTDDVPDRLLYLAPGHELSRKLGYVHD